MNTHVNEQITTTNNALTLGLQQTRDLANVQISYVSNTLGLRISNVESYINTTITPDLTVLHGNIVQLTNALIPLANINSPNFTGIPTAPTTNMPVWSTMGHSAYAGDNSGNIATTQFVVGAIAGQKFNYTVSSSPPTGGVTGDFWFQIGG